MKPCAGKNAVVLAHRVIEDNQGIHAQSHRLRTLDRSRLWAMEDAAGLQPGTSSCEAMPGSQRARTPTYR